MVKNFKYDSQKEFESSRDMLKYFLGLELCLAEQIILRDIIYNTIDCLSEMNLGHDTYQPAVEGAIRFLFREYGVHPSNRDLCNPIIGGYPDFRSGFVLSFLQDQRNKI